MISSIIYEFLFRLAEIIYPTKKRMRDRFRVAVKNRKLTIKDCKCKFVRGQFKTCKFHKKCIGTPCASGINKCDNPKH